jgi:carboxyl-terminal processing protease
MRTVMLRWATSLMATFIMSVLLVPTTAGSTPCPTPAPPSPSAVLLSEAARLERFDAIWSAVEERSVDPQHHGVDWAVIRTEFAPRIAAATTDAEVDAILSAMVDRLGEDQARYEPRPDRDSPTASFTGIGILAGRVATDADEGIGITYVLPGGPADRAGLRERDRILAVDGAACATPEILRGPAGTTVELLVQSPAAAPRSVTLERGLVEPRFVPDAGLLPTGDGRRVGYLRMPSLAPPDAASTVEAALSDLLASGSLDGVVFDLRSVDGTDHEIADAIAGQFRSGPSAMVQDRTTSEPWITPRGRLLPRLGSVPLVVLVDAATAGSAEMLAALLHVGGRAAIAGSPTSGTADQLSEAIPVPGGGILWVVTRRVVQQDGTPIVPVPIDIPVAVAWTDEPASTDSAIAAAMTSFGCHGD